MYPVIIPLTSWCIALVPGLLLWQETSFENEVNQGQPGSAEKWREVAEANRSWVLVCITLGLFIPFCTLWMANEPMVGGIASVLAPGIFVILFAAYRQVRNARSVVELEDMGWIIRQRGSVQDQMMRACEREAMERRLRRCQSTLMLTRRGGRDLAKLFRLLESQVATMDKDAHEAAVLVSSFAAHLRHVFMESDRDDIPLGEACEHVARWGRVLEQLGVPAIRISGAPDQTSPHFKSRVPALLLLGAVERIGVKALEVRAAQQLHWTWQLDGENAQLISEGGGQLELSREEWRDWHAAFMLRHGGIAHAGGTWTFELPLLPG